MHNQSNKPAAAADLNSKTVVKRDDPLFCQQLPAPTPVNTIPPNPEAEELINRAEKLELVQPREAGKLAHKVLALRDITGHVRARAVRLLATAAVITADFDLAGSRFREALELFEANNDMIGVAKCLGELGLVEFTYGNYKTALDFSRRSLKAHKAAGNEFGEAVENMRLGILMQHLGELPRALEHLIEAYEFLRHDQTPKAYAGALNNLALVHKDLGQHEQALKFFNECLDICISDNNPKGIALVHSNLGVTYEAMQKWSDALVHLEQSLQIARQTADLRQQAIALMNIASIQYNQAEYTLAAENYAASMQVVAGLKVEHNKADPMVGLARCKIMLGEIDQATDLMESAAKHIETNGGLELRSALYQAFVDLNDRKGDPAAALEWSRKLLKVEQEKMQRVNDEKLSNLRIIHETELARQEADIHRLENVELAAANTRLEELIRSNNEFLGVVAHDLRNPLSNIQGMARLISTQVNNFSQEDISELGDDISESAGRMLKLVASLLDINRIDQGRLNIRPTEFDLAQTAKRYLSVSRSSAAQKQIELHFSGPDSGVFAYADRDIIVQVLDNLVSNALKFSPPGSRVEVIVNTDAQSKKARITVRDQGPGLTAQDMQQLFGKFARLSAQPTAGEASTGLGLSIVKQLVEAMQGQVWCESQHGAGASFIVELPTQAPQLSS